MCHAIQDVAGSMLQYEVAYVLSIAFSIIFILYVITWKLCVYRLQIWLIQSRASMNDKDWQHTQLPYGSISRYCLINSPRKSHNVSNTYHNVHTFLLQTAA